MLKKLFIAALIISFLGLICLAGLGTWGYYYICRDLPDFHTIEDYRPPIVSKVFSNDGTIVGEFYKERRYPIKIKDIPVLVRNAFLAAEDANFYKHPGIDPIGIIRAVVKNFRSGTTKQGGSTITQQVVKNLLLTREKKIERKVKEAILSYRLEQRLSKDEILELYLNQIFFGNTAYGIRAATLTYFHKEPKDITLAEAAMLAGLPKAPSTFSPIVNPKNSKRRQKYVLSRMVAGGFVTEDAADAALREKVKVYPASQENIFRAPYFVAEIRRVMSEKWRDYDIDADGLQIYTSLDLAADSLAVPALRKGLREVDKRRGWRGPIGSIAHADHELFVKNYGSVVPDSITSDNIYPGMITEIARGVAKVDLGAGEVQIDLENTTWARRFLDKQDRASGIKPESMLKLGDVIEVSLEKAHEVAVGTKGEKRTQPAKFILDQTPNIEGALELSDPMSGKVLAMVGGYSYQHSQFNRVTQSLRQPGSSFKPVVYLTAIDQFRFTPATIVHDAPREFHVGDEVWTPGNFDSKYMGAITLRTALEHSRNLVSAELIERMGIDPVIQTARKLGFTSKLGRNLSLSLGSSEVTLEELVRAYGVFAAKGVLFDTNMITKIVDRNGKVVFDYDSEKLSHARRVINENSAFIMANLMKGVVERGTGYRVKEINRPVAAKTGTSNEEMDTWFIGYTPEWVCGVWVGFDLKKKIGGTETGGKVAAPVWLYFMRDFLNLQDDKKYQKLVEETKAESQRLGIEYVPPDPLEPLDFSVPDGVDPFWVDKNTGVLSSPGDPGALYEYFIKGTEPSKALEESIGQGGKEATGAYLDAPDL